MIFRRGAAVVAEDGPYGVLDDVVVDSFTQRVTQVVVDPGGDHQQTRLVPLWLLNESDEGIRIALPSSHVRQLQRALLSDYVRVSSRILEGDTAPRFKTVLTLPYFRDDAVHALAQAVGVEGIPQAECEIRRSSWVVGSTDRVLGTVEGFLVEDELLHSVVVRSGVIGHRHNVAVPISNVVTVGSHMVNLDIDRHTFRRCPVTQAVPSSGRHLRPKDVWQEVLGRPSNKLWDDFELQPPD